MPRTSRSSRSPESFPWDRQTDSQGDAWRPFQISTCETCEPGDSDVDPDGGLSPEPTEIGAAWFGNQGLGEPLVGASWLNRPLHVGGFVGGITGDSLTDDLDLEPAFFGGIRLGCDYDHYWGIESRLAFASVDLEDQTSPAVQHTGDVLLWDASLLYYPWGDSRWRPYLTLGVGLADFSYVNQDDAHQSTTAVGVPWGAGLKYRHSPWLALRLDLLDNVSLESGELHTMQNVSLTGGIEYHFGGSRKSYWPWSPGLRSP